MKSLEYLEELNKMLIDANKRADIVYEDVGEYDRQKCDFEHEILNQYPKMTAKDKRQKIDDFYELMVERKNRKLEQKELQTLKELYSLSGLQKAMDTAISSLRKLNQEIEAPIYHKRAKKNKGEIVIVKEAKDENISDRPTEI